MHKEDLWYTGARKAFFGATVIFEQSACLFWSWIGCWISARLPSSISCSSAAVLRRCWTTRCRAFTEKKSEVSSLSTAVEASTLWRPLYHTTILTTKRSSAKNMWRVHSSQPAQVFDTILEKVNPAGCSLDLPGVVLVWISLQPHLQFTKPLTKWRGTSKI